MKTIILSLIFCVSVFAQSTPFFILFENEVSTPYGDELITNGTFDVNINGWANYPGLEFETFEWSDGKLHLVNSGGRSLAGGTSFAVESGKTYRIIISVTYNSGNLDGIFISLYAYNVARLLISNGLTANAEIDVEFNCSVTENVHITFDMTRDSDFLIDNISVKEILNP